MNSKLVIAQDKFMDDIGKLCDSFGLNRFIAQLYALLYLSDKPLSLDDMATRLNVSKGNVSINIRVLEQWGAAKSIWIKGSRKDFYEAELDIKKVFSNRLKSFAQRRITEVSGLIDDFNNIIESADPELTEEEKKIAQAFKGRLKKIEELKSLASSALSLAEKFL